MNPTIKTILIVLPILLIIGLLIAHFSAPYAIIKRPKFPSPNPQTPANFGLDYEKITIWTADSLNLMGFYVPTPLETSVGSIILLHGIGSCKENLLWLVLKFTNAGYNCFALDSRAHGESEGEYITFGYYEKYDIAKVIDFLEQEKGQHNIGIRGVSMGGAIALQSLEYDKRLKFGIIESTFADLRTVVFDYQKLWLGLNSRFLSDNALNRAAKIAKFKVKDIQPAESAKNIEQPVFYAHGTMDVNISIAYGKRVFENLASKQKEFVAIENADHFNVHEAGGEQLWQQILAFLNRIK